MVSKRRMISINCSKVVDDPSPITSGRALSTPSVITTTALRRFSARDVPSTCSRTNRSASQKFVPPCGFSILSMLLLKASRSEVKVDTTSTSAVKVTIATRSTGRTASMKRFDDLRIKPILSAVEPDRSNSKTRSKGASFEAKNEISWSAPFSKMAKSFCCRRPFVWGARRLKMLTLRLTRSVSIRSVSVASDDWP